MILSLPYPPAWNHYLRIWRGRPVKSAKARAYQKAVAVLFQKCPGRALEGPLRVSVSLYRPARRGDIDGPLKCLLDALNGIAWIDDSQIVELHAFRGDDKLNPRAVVTVEAA